MNYGSRYLGSCATSSVGDEVDFSWNEFVRGILLFDTFVLESMRLREFPLLIDQLGVEAVCDMLSGGAVELVAEAISIGEITASMKPHNSLYKCNVIRSADQKAYVHSCLQCVRDIDRLSKRESQRVRLAIANAVKETPDDYRLKSLRQLNHNLESNPIMVAPALAASAMQWEKVSLRKEGFSIRCEPKGNEWYFVDFDHPDAKSLSDEQKQNIIRRGILASVDLDVRFEAMERHKAVPVVNPLDVALVDDRMSMLLENMQSGVQKKRFERLERILDLPDMSNSIASGKLDYEGLIGLRNSDECREFRRWLPNMDGKSDDEIKDLFSSTRARIASKLGTGTGKMMRFAAATGLGLIDPTGFVAGAIDTFLLDKVFPNRGPLIFVNDMYPSVFQKK